MSASQDTSGALRFSALKSQDGVRVKRLTSDCQRPNGLCSSRALLERHGFTVEREEHALLEHNPFGLWQSLVNRVTRTPSWFFNALKRNAPLVHPDALITLALLPLAPLCLLAERAFGRSRRGGTIAVLARRL